ncbi:MAG: 3-deoxy-7-phosphoheptulonate synthase [Frankiaceae bacterium]
MTTVAALAARPKHGTTAVPALRSVPPVVTLKEIDRLTTVLAAAARGEACLLRVAQPVALGEASMRGFLLMVRRIRMAFTYAAGRPAVVVHDAVPSSGELEIGAAPDRVDDSYARSACSTNLLRAMLANGNALGEASPSVAGHGGGSGSLGDFLMELERALRFMTALGPDWPEPSRDVFTSHHTVLLDYERHLLRVDSTEPRPRLYAGSAHLLRQAPSANHLGRIATGFGGLIANPIDLAFTATALPREVARYVDQLDPDRVPGRVVLTCELSPHSSAARSASAIEAVVEAINEAGHAPVWQCDPLTRDPAQEIARAVDGYATFVDALRRSGAAAGSVVVDVSGVATEQGEALAMSLARVLHG